MWILDVPVGVRYCGGVGGVGGTDQAYCFAEKEDEGLLGEVLGFVHEQEAGCKMSGDEDSDHGVCTEESHSWELRSGSGGSGGGCEVIELSVS